MRALLLAYDGSDTARLAASFAIEMATLYSAALHVLCVSGDRALGMGIDTESVVDQEFKHCEDVLSELDLGGIEHTKSSVAIGSAAHEIIRYARENDIDHIVVGHRGHSLLDRWMIGSVSRHVVAFAPCAVTVIPDPQADASNDHRAEAAERGD